jgi:predicted NUDIX family NTP pyrophosphohydrolase
MYRRSAGALELFLVHPGGPFWRNKDLGAWTIPKGEIEPGEEPLAAACREFEEETAIVPVPPFLALAPVRQRGGKIVHAFAFEGDGDPAAVRSNPFTIEWPPRSGRTQTFPEIDRAAFFGVDEALARIHPDQAAFVRELVARLSRELA